jgi:hypothetical protein
MPLNATQCHSRPLKGLKWLAPPPAQHPNFETKLEHKMQAEARIVGRHRCERVGDGPRSNSIEVGHDQRRVLGAWDLSAFSINKRKFIAKIQPQSLAAMNHASRKLF